MAEGWMERYVFVQHLRALHDGRHPLHQVRIVSTTSCARRMYPTHPNDAQQSPMNRRSYLCLTQVLSVQSQSGRPAQEFSELLSLVISRCRLYTMVIHAEHGQFYRVASMG